MNTCVLELINYEVEQLMFTSNSDYMPNPAQKIAVEPELTVKIMKAEDNEKITKVVINCTVFKDANINNFPFEAFVEISGTFSIDMEEKKDVDQVIRYNATAILLPYLRTITSQLTCLAEKRPVRIPIINVYDLFDKAEEQEPA